MWKSFSLLDVSNKKIYTYGHIIQWKNSRPVVRMEKRVHVKITKASDLTLREVFKKIEEIQAENPDLDVFFDGDEYAICSRPRKVDER